MRRLADVRSGLAADVGGVGENRRSAVRAEFVPGMIVAVGFV